jgi:NhaA family Na+:H+ antiporter
MADRAARGVPAAAVVRRQAATLLRPFQAFFELEAASGLILLGCAAVAVVWANGRWASTYTALWSTEVTIGGGPLVLAKPLLLWVNDGLMALFFFVVGLEIKREVLTGELSSQAKATLPIGAALGGMLAPAGLYLVLNTGHPGARGWGIPMATDIAFALGVLALLGPRVPTTLRVFLTAVAIADDVGAVLVIALFYTEQLSLVALGIAGLLGVALLAVNRAHVAAPAIYAILGVALWVAVLKSGIHATIAGILVAMAIPARRSVDSATFLARARAMLETFEHDRHGKSAALTEDQRDAAYSLEMTCRRVDAPLTRLEHALHPWVAYGIMPVFALANAGVGVSGEALAAAAADRVALGILLGLVVGKQLGVTAACWLLVRTGVATLPARATWRHLYGVALLCGIGFTMSLFIAALAFPGGDTLERAKMGILAASAISALLGLLVLGVGAPVEPRAREVTRQ